MGGPLVLDRIQAAPLLCLSGRKCFSSPTGPQHSYTLFCQRFLESFSKLPLLLKLHRSYKLAANYTSFASDLCCVLIRSYIVEELSSSAGGIGARKSLHHHTCDSIIRAKQWQMAHQLSICTLIFEKSLRFSICVLFSFKKPAVFRVKV